MSTVPLCYAYGANSLSAESICNNRCPEPKEELGGLLFFSGQWAEVRSLTHVFLAEYYHTEFAVKGYLAHKKLPPLHRTAIGAYAYAYCRVLGGGVFS